MFIIFIIFSVFEWLFAAAATCQLEESINSLNSSQAMEQGQRSGCSCMNWLQINTCTLITPWSHLLALLSWDFLLDAAQDIESVYISYGEVTINKKKKREKPGQAGCNPHSKYTVFMNTFMRNMYE